MKQRDRTKAELLDEIADLRHEITALREGGKDPGGSLIEDELRASEEKYRALVESTDDSIYLVDRGCRYLHMNKKHLSRLGISMEEALGRTYGDFHSPEETAEFALYVEEVLTKGKSAQHEHRSLRDGGHFLWTMSPMRGRDGKVQSVTVVSKNITCLKEMEARLYMLSFSDELTGVYNRRGFLTLAEQQMKLAKRSKKVMLLIYADLDDLKWINDTYGHAEGDVALKNFTGIMKASFRESDIIARIGGDEFVILITDLLKTSQSSHLARLHKNLEKFNTKSPRVYSLSVSTGSVLFDPNGSNRVEQILGKADQLMYEQKSRRQRTR
jgi:diguanylate cyclase (GGDEF)-like protein/PAS domain S-box-containing protein